MRKRSTLLAAALALTTAACVGQEQIVLAAKDLNDWLRAQYERVLAEKCRRTFKVRRDTAFDAMRASLVRLGMRIELEDRNLGLLSAFGPAPRPLTQEEWRQAADKDVPEVRKVLSRQLGMHAEKFQFEPESFEIVITATFVGQPAATEIALTMRMRETQPPKPGMPRREYAPPTAVRIGLDKIWAEFDRQLQAQ